MRSQEAQGWQYAQGIWRGYTSGSAPDGSALWSVTYLVHTEEEVATVQRRGEEREEPHALYAAPATAAGGEVEPEEEEDDDEEDEPLCERGLHVGHAASVVARCVAAREWSEHIRKSGVREADWGGGGGEGDVVSG